MEQESLGSSKPANRKVVSAVMASVLVAALIAGGGAYAYERSRQAKSHNDLQAQIESLKSQLSENQRPATNPLPISSVTSTPNLLSGRLIISSVGSNSAGNYITQYVFNPVSTRVEKTTINVAAADYNNAEYSVGDNETVQVASNGDTYYYESVGVEGGIGGGPSPSVSFTEIRKAPNGVIFHQDGTRVVAKAWKLTKNGSKLYVLLPAATGSGSDVYVINTVTLAKQRVATVGTVSTPIFLNADESQLLVGEDRKRVEGGYEYHDYYSRQANLATGSVTEKFLWKDHNNGHFPFFDLSSFAFGPKLLKAVAVDRSNGNYTLHSINLADGKESDLYQFKGPEGDNIAEWSSNGLQVLFATGAPFAADFAAPIDQGILLYDFDTNKTTQIIKTNIATKGPNAVGYAPRLVRNSFDGTSFVYSEGNSIYYYDISSGTKTLLVSDIPQLDGLIVTRI